MQALFQGDDDYDDGISHQSHQVNHQENPKELLLEFREVRKAQEDEFNHRALVFHFHVNSGAYIVFKNIGIKHCINYSTKLQSNSSELGSVVKQSGQKM